MGSSVTQVRWLKVPHPITCRYEEDDHGATTMHAFRHH